MSHTNSTPNYGLPEFLSSDKPAWMTDINVAFSDIDTAMKNNTDAASAANTDVGTLGLNFAAGYSNSSTYDVGDVVTYNKRMYVCDIAVTVPEAFDNGKWSYYRVSDTADAVANVTAAENALEGVVGSDDISAIGASCTDAIINLNANLSDVGDATLIGTLTNNVAYSHDLSSYRFIMIQITQSTDMIILEHIIPVSALTSTPVRRQFANYISASNNIVADMYLSKTAEQVIVAINGWTLGSIKLYGIK